MIKLKLLVEDITDIEQDNVPEIDVDNVPEAESEKTINDEFQVNDWMLTQVKKMLEKVNKKLKARSLPELELNIIKDEVAHYTVKVKGGTDIDKYKKIYTIKIDGDIPQINDYEFVAKIQHTPQGNIINMSPKSTVEKLPDEYKSHTQRCDICKTNRERNDTFIVKKVDTGELLCAGRNCLGKFMPLDVVKAFVEYAVRLQDMRNVLADYEDNVFSDDERYTGGRGGYVEELTKQEDLLFYCCVIYFDDNKNYISNTVAKNTEKKSTLAKASTLKYYYENFHPKMAEFRKEATEVIKRHEEAATKMANEVLTWAKIFDFDKAAQESPAMDSYFHNLKVLIQQPYLQGRNFGYFASLISLYLRELEKGKEKVARGPNEYYGTVGEKFVNVPVETTFITSVETQYGTMWIYSFRDNENHIFVYKGKNLGIDKGDWVQLSATIKSHQDYKGAKQTIVQRPKTKKIGEQ